MNNIKMDMSKAKIYMTRRIDVGDFIEMLPNLKYGKTDITMAKIPLMTVLSIIEMNCEYVQFGARVTSLEMGHYNSGKRPEEKVILDVNSTVSKQYWSKLSGKRFRIIRGIRNTDDIKLKVYDIVEYVIE